MLADVHAIGFHSHGKVTSTNQPPAVQFRLLGFNGLISKMRKLLFLFWPHGV